MPDDTQETQETQETPAPAEVSQESAPAPEATRTPEPVEAEAAAMPEDQRQEGAYVLAEYVGPEGQQGWASGDECYTLTRGDLVVISREQAYGYSAKLGVWDTTGAPRFVPFLDEQGQPRVLTFAPHGHYRVLTRAELAGVDRVRAYRVNGARLADEL